MTKQIKVVATADLHFGNLRLDACSVYDKLRKYLYPQLQDAHLFIIAGDLLDMLVTVGSNAHYFASKFIKDVFTLSARTGMTVRLLSGTYTHDRDQLPVFKTLALPKTKFKIVDTIDCEVIQGFNSVNGYVDYDLAIGYLPDNLSYKDSADAIAHLKRIMECKGVSTLETIICHGTFEHIVRPGVPCPPCTYKIAQFDFVKGPIICGHIHTSSRKHNVYYCGSFDRMSHGEEENKGYYVFLDTDGSWKAKFVVDEDANKFITVTPDEDMDISQCSKYFVEQVEKYIPSGIGCVRTVHKDAEVRAILRKICFNKFPNIVYSSKSIQLGDATSIHVEDITLDIFDDVKPDENNLGELAYKFLVEKQLDGGIPESAIVEKTKELIDANIRK